MSRSAKQIIFLGPPGAGKGTQAALLAKKLGIAVVSTGAIMREAVASGSALGLKVKAFLDRGELVPDALVVEIVGAKLMTKECSAGFILDGFPRTVVQADQLAAMTGVHISDVLSLEAPEDVLVGRLLERAKSEGRSDDNETVIKSRLGVFREKTAPLVEYYRKHGLLRVVQGIGEIDEIQQDILNKLGV